MPCLDLGYEIVSDQVTLALDNGSIGPQDFNIEAPEGKVILSGGFEFIPPPSGFQSNATTPESWPGSPTVWNFRFRGGNDPNNRQIVDIYAVCVNE